MIYSTGLINVFGPSRSDQDCSPDFQFPVTHPPSMPWMRRAGASFRRSFRVQQIGISRSYSEFCARFNLVLGLPLCLVLLTLWRAKTQY